MDAETFEADRKTQSAVLHNIAVLGEAVKKLPPEFRAEHPTVAWKKIAGIRDKMIHEYRKIKIPLVWHVLNDSIPELIGYIQPLLPKE